MKKKQWKIWIAAAVWAAALMLGGCKGMEESREKDENREEETQDVKSDGKTDTEKEEVKHLLAMTDLTGGIRVVDLEAEDPTAAEAIVWEWKPKEEDGWKLAQNRLALSIDDVKLRWSEYYQKEVVIMTASNNWAGIADYATGQCLWEEEVPRMPHAIELLPNGDVVVAGSGGDNYMKDGCLMYYNVSKGAQCRQTDLQLLSSAHGLLWDPLEEVLWAVGWEQLAAYQVADEKLTKLEDKGCRLLYNNGHDLSADYYDPDQLLITTGKKVYKFSKEENKLLIEYNFSDVLLNSVDTKGITSFDDGTVAYCVATKVKTSYDTDTVHVIRLEEERGVGVQTTYIFPEFTTYKVRNFQADYQ